MSQKKNHHKPGSTTRQSVRGLLQNAHSKRHHPTIKDALSKLREALHHTMEETFNAAQRLANKSKHFWFKAVSDKILGNHHAGVGRNDMEGPIRHRRIKHYHYKKTHAKPAGAQHSWHPPYSSHGGPKGLDPREEMCHDYAKTHFNSKRNKTQWHGDSRYLFHNHPPY